MIDLSIFECVCLAILLVAVVPLLIFIYSYVVTYAAGAARISLFRHYSDPSDKKEAS